MSPLRRTRLRLEEFEARTNPSTLGDPPAGDGAAANTAPPPADPNPPPANPGDPGTSPISTTVAPDPQPVLLFDLAQLATDPNSVGRVANNYTVTFRLVFESGRIRNVDVTFNSGDWLIDAGDAAVTQLRAAGLDARRQGNILMIAGEQLANDFDSVESGSVVISKVNGINVATPLQSQMGSSSGWWSA